MISDEVLSNLVKQVLQRINEILGEGAYDTIRIKRAVSLIPRRKKVTFRSRLSA
ncbi:hypothetical protein [Candidatus Enterovibrio altilux]|uniref:Mobile element protein n=1 Tax=Candidatus Enterovibrio altilux TaxID=1927128 RepID=A0A291B8X8_9GAMM|nr:hypothetical protein BTN50_0949 [Candidatus Enterovibrio luxaltus]